MLSTINHRQSTIRQGFTLIELLVVVGIIAVLISILIPVIGRVRISGQEADSKAFLATLDLNIHTYHTNFSAYPGPVPNSALANGSVTGVDQIFDAVSGQPINDQLTGAENLVLGLLGGLNWNTARTQIQFFKDEVGRGPVSLNYNLAAAKRYDPMGERVSLSNGSFSDDAGAAKDTAVPEFLDKFSNPLPILYMRARPAVKAGGTVNANNNNVVAMNANPSAMVAPYRLDEITGYTDSPIGVGKSPNKSEYKTAPTPPFNHGLSTVDPTYDPRTKKDNAAYIYPLDAYTYLVNPATVADPRSAATMLNESARQKDSYILISAGRDRIYGTKDDLTSFGEVSLPN